MGYRKTSSGDEWTGAEIRTVVSIYPDCGAKAVARELPHRSVPAIYSLAQQMHITRRGIHRGRHARAQ